MNMPYPCYVYWCNFIFSVLTSSIFIYQRKPTGFIPSEENIYLQKKTPKQTNVDIPTCSITWIKENSCDGRKTAADPLIAQRCEIKKNWRFYLIVKLNL